MIRPVRRLWALLLALPLTLGGCLIPQPDTPPIPPGSPGSMAGSVAAPSAKRNVPPTEPRGSTSAAPAAAEDASSPPANPPTAASAAPMPQPTSVSTNSDTGSVSNAGGLQPTLTSPSVGTVEMVRKSAEPGRLTVDFTGEVPKVVWLVAVDGTAEVSPTLDKDGFTIGLAAGDYWLDIVDAGVRRRSRTPLSVPAGGERKLEVTVAAAQLTIEEVVALEAQPPKPAPEPSASP